MKGTPISICLFIFIFVVLASLSSADRHVTLASGRAYEGNSLMDLLGNELMSQDEKRPKNSFEMQYLGKRRQQEEEDLQTKRDVQHLVGLLARKRPKNTFSMDYLGKRGLMTPLYSRIFRALRTPVRKAVQIPYGHFALD